MWSSKIKTACRCAVSVLTAAVLAATGGIALGAEASDLTEQLAVAKEALKQAQAAERDAGNAQGSLGMARAATGAIVTAAKATLARGNKLLTEAQELLKQQTAAAKAAAEKANNESDPDAKKTLQQQAGELAAEQAELEKLVVQRTARRNAYQEQLANDQAVATRAAAKFNDVGRIREKCILSTWDCVRDVQAIEAKIARSAAQKVDTESQAAQKTLATATAAAKTAAEKAAAEADAAKKKTLQDAATKAAAEKQAAEKTLAAKTAAAKAAADKAAAADKTLRQTEAAIAIDTQGWNVIELGRTQQRLRAKAASAAQLAKQAAAEKDPAKKKELEAAAAKAATEKTATEKEVAQQQAVIQASVAHVYSLRVAAVGGMKPLSTDAWDYDKARHLLTRAGFGGTPQEVQKLCDLGLYKAVDQLVDFYRQPPANVPFDAVPPPAVDPLEAKLRISTAKSRTAAAKPRATAYGGQQGRLVQWWLKRMVESPRPLQEKLTLFWHGHFATQASVVGHSYSTYHHNQLLREHAAGNFGALLYGIVHDPAMLRYLDNNSNVKGNANENLAREIMELFAMGVDQGYNEVDIRDAARALTGYTFDSATGQFRFIGANHDETPKAVFGRKGNWTGDDLVKLILEQPATSRFIARKLFVFFAHENPSTETVEQLSAVLRGYNYELAPMLKNLFLSEEFYSSQAVGRQYKSPVQLAVGTLRTLGVKRVADAGTLNGATTKMGQQLFEPPDVKGWRYGRSWISSNRIFVRYNSISALVRGVPQPNGRRGVDMVALVEAGGCKSSEQVVDYLIKACLVTPLDDEKRAELIGFAKDLPPLDQWAKQRDAVSAKLQSLVVLLTSSPDYQLN